jgi:lipopolysaccharide export LptBFGC system permease protein LptF
MQGVTEFMQQHSQDMEAHMDEDHFLEYHLKQIGFLQHERLIHLLVMLFVIVFALSFFVLFLSLHQIMFLVLFIILLILAAFYIAHYFKLENTVIRWYYVYDEKVKEEGWGH